MKLVGVQLDVTPGAVEENVDRALNRVREAAAAGADLVVLPELFDVGYFAFDAYEHAAESLAGDRLSRFAAAAADSGVAVLAGTVVEDLAASAADGLAVPAESGLANAAVLFDADGERRLVYPEATLVRVRFGGDRPDDPRRADADGDGRGHHRRRGDLL